MPLWLALSTLAGIAGCRPGTGESSPAQSLASAAGRRGPAPITVSPDSWVLATDRWDGETLGTYRGAYLGNGFLGQRVMQLGTAADPGAGEGSASPAGLPAHVAGHYVRETLASLPPVLALEIATAGRTFGAAPQDVTRYRQELRLREGVLRTAATWEGGSGPVEIEVDSALLQQAPRLALLKVRIDNTRGSHEVAVRAPAAPDPGDGLRYTRVVRALDGAAAPAGGEVVVPGGKTVLLACVTHVAGGWAPADGLEKPGALEARLTAEQVESWLSGHRKAWERLWASDIEIEGDPEAQQVVRACLYHLLSSVRAGGAAGVPPMGLSAPAFNGHVFWDQESWIVPALLPQHPELVRAMLEYRRRTLDGARANAREEGLPGASYAWESGLTGRETLKDAVFRHGRHVSGDIALALGQYYAAVGDRAWLSGIAWPVLKDTADNWVARAKPDGRGGLVIRGVTTPDENAGQVDHSAWTHHVARANLLLAGAAARELGRPADPRWAATAGKLGFLRDAGSGRILPYAGFTEKTKAKQADVLLLSFPGEADLPEAELGKMYDFYAPRVIANGPAMTDAVHAVVAARLGRGEEALRRFRDSYRPFVRPPFHVFSEKRTRDNLCFLTGAAGVVEAVLYGFGGLRVDPLAPAAERPELEPHLPEGWTALRLRGFRWRGKAWDVELKPGSDPVWTARTGG